MFAAADAYYELHMSDRYMGLVAMFTLLLCFSTIMIIFSGILLCGVYLEYVQYVQIWFWAALFYGVLRLVALVGYCLILALLGGDKFLLIRIIILFVELGWITFSLIIGRSYIKLEGELTSSESTEEEEKKETL